LNDVTRGRTIACEDRGLDRYDRAIGLCRVGRDGRKRIAEAAAHGESGTLLAVARATWIEVDRKVQLGRV
jgi:hypothetical protein